MASDAPLDIELELARTGRPFIDAPMHFSRLGLNAVEDLLAALALDEQGMLSFARRAGISTDDNNLMATRSRTRADGIADRRSGGVVRTVRPSGEARKLDPLASWAGNIDYGYLARRLIRLSRAPRATELAAAIPDFSTQFEVYGLLFRATGQGDRAPESLANALRANPTQHAGALHHRPGPSRCAEPRGGAGGHPGDRRGACRTGGGGHRGHAVRSCRRLGDRSPRSTTNSPSRC